MLCGLHISHYILIDSLDIQFPEGLVIITGQTGAGKSILLGALSLLAGAKAEASVIRGGADSCVVEAEFSLSGPQDKLKAILEENDIEFDGTSLTIRRIVFSSGRSRSFINECPVALPVLQEASSLLVDIHSQHQSLLLTDHSFQMGMLDNYSGNAELLSRTASAWKSLRTLETEKAELQARLAALDGENEYNAAQFRQLDEAKLVPGEMESLEEEQERLANAEEIKSSLSGALAMFDPSEDSLRGIEESLKELSRQLEKASRYIPSLKELSGRVESSRIDLADIRDEIDREDARIDVSPERLELVEERISLLLGLMKKHSCQTVDELIAVRDRYASLSAGPEALMDRLSDLEKDLSRARDAYSDLSGKLSDSRRTHAVDFAAGIQEKLHLLELDHSVFKLEVSPAEPSATGSDQLRFLFSATGGELAEIAKCASGGEISRIMLCLKEMMARFAGMPTMIFDEIDTGVSGSVADKMGRIICSMGRNMQVFSITHLPQVAAKGDAHFVVNKTVSEDGTALSSISRVEGQDRVNEIARLLSGSTITAEAIANAASLISQ